ncbi:MAG: GGDEF domain-containing protein [Deferrisomatales bacterium]
MVEDREEHYRRKYLDLLSEVEAKEASWAQVGQRLQRIVAHLMIVAEGPGSADTSAELTQLRDSLRAGLDLDALEARLETLKERVLRETRWAETRATLPPIHEILIHVVERLPLPPEMNGEALAVVESLETGIGPDGLPEAIEAVTGLVYRVQARVQDEKRELEGLLLEVTNRLQQLGQGLTVTHQEISARGDAFRAFGDALAGHVRGLEERAAAAADLEGLRRLVRGALEAIQTQLASHRSGDGTREQRLQEEIQRLQRTAAELQAEVNDHREKTRQARELSLRDALTGCYNRLAYQERAQAEEARWLRYHTALSLVVLDLDRFKTINDTFGHRAGDQVLKAVVQTALGQLRQADFLSRHGGEEFVILLPETPLAAARAAAEKIRRAVAAFRFHSRGRRIPITVSCGVAQLRPGDTLETAFERADRALYRAKALGRNRTEDETGETG